MIYFWLINLNHFLRLIQLKQVWVITINLFLHFLNPKRQDWSQKSSFIETKKFDEKSFLYDLQNKNFSISSNDTNVNYKSITENFLGAIDKHAPLKKKLVRGNQASFMSRDFQANSHPSTELWHLISIRDMLDHKDTCAILSRLHRYSLHNLLKKYKALGCLLHW